MINATIWDMDGTLFKNIEIHFKAIGEILAPYNISVEDPEVQKKLSGRTAYESLKFLLKNSDDEEIRQIAVQKEELYRKFAKGKIIPINGLEELLIKLANAKIPCALATSGTAENVIFNLSATNLSNYFSVSVNGDEVKFGKPDPDIFILATKRLKIQPHECVVFEDSEAGILAAKSAGMKTIFITTYHQPHEVPNADLYIDDYTDLTVEMITQLS
jgi:beta-phosphoglucomutase